MNRAEQLKYQFMRELKLRNYADSSIRTYADCIMQYFRYMNGKKPADKNAHTEMIKDYLLSITNQNYHKQMLAAIRNFYDFVLQQPLSLKDIPYPRPTNYLPNILSVQETAAMIGKIENVKHRAIIQLMYSCAMRIGEVIKIRIEDVDSQRQLLKIAGAKGFKDRYVPLPTPTIMLLRTYYSQYKPTSWLFAGQLSGEQYSIRSIQQVFHRACDAAGIRKKVTPHSLRHSRLTHLKEAGVDIYELKDIAGHSQIKTTEIYLHLAKQHLVDRIAIADTVLSQISGTQLLKAS